MAVDSTTLDECLGLLADRLLDRRTARDHWDGYLASSALSTGTAVLALHLAGRHRKWSSSALAACVVGARWLIGHQNADGGWGDTTRSRSNVGDVR